MVLNFDYWIVVFINGLPVVAVRELSSAELQFSRADLHGEVRVLVLLVGALFSPEPDVLAAVQVSGTVPVIDVASRVIPLSNTRERVESE